ncbi:hypothetical protein [Paucilactobacillus hokkaidonensis]|nr:hypothetical protein [Paucilactobacillus hokkaidonensis]
MSADTVSPASPVVERSVHVHKVAIFLTELVLTLVLTELRDFK